MFVVRVPGGRREADPVLRAWRRLGHRYERQGRGPAPHEPATTWAERIDKASPQVRAWQARAPILSAEARLPSARIATGLGVFSSQALMDLYAAVYDATDPSDLGQTDAWQVRLAMVGKDIDTLDAGIAAALGWKR